MVTIVRYGDGVCIWCLEKSDGVQAQFRDGLQGFFCRKHFWQALRVRAEEPPVPESAPVKSTTPGKESTATK